MFICTYFNIKSNKVFVLYLFIILFSKKLPCGALVVFTLRLLAHEVVERGPGGELPAIRACGERVRKVVMRRTPGTLVTVV